MLKQKYNIYLDDIRNPHTDMDFIIIRSYDKCIEYINKHGIPTYISFDHDIASFDKDGNEKTGYDVAKYIVDFCIDNNINCPDFNVHSANSVGRDNIEYLLNNFIKYKNK